jgi:hypothetical protein
MINRKLILVALLRPSATLSASTMEPDNPLTYATAGTTTALFPTTEPVTEGPEEPGGGYRTIKRGGGVVDDEHEDALSAFRQFWENVENGPKTRTRTKPPSPSRYKIHSASSGAFALGSRMKRDYK